MTKNSCLPLASSENPEAFGLAFGVNGTEKFNLQTQKAKEEWISGMFNAQKSYIQNRQNIRSTQVSALCTVVVGTPHDRLCYHQVRGATSSYRFSTGIKNLVKDIKSKINE